MPNKTHYYSFAGTYKGREDPDDIEIIHIHEGSDCPLHGCILDREHEHIQFQWSGDEYSDRGAWISAINDEDSVYNLEDHR